MTDKTKYLVLINLASKDKSTAQSILANLNNASGQNAKVIWTDTQNIGIVVSTAGSAHDLWNSTVNRLNESCFSNLLIVSLGNDWCAKNDTVANGWLNAHVGRPAGETFRSLPGYKKG